MKVKTKTWAVGVGVVLIAGAGWGMFGRNPATGAPAWSAPAVKVAVAPATQAPLSVALVGIGSLEASRQVQLSAEIDGRVAQILFQPGERVRAGQRLVQLNDAPEQGELLRLQAQARNTRALLDRTRRLLPQQAATREQLEQAQADYEQALGDIKRVQALIEQKRINAPFDGQLGVRRVNLGQFARAGDPLVSLTDNREMYANITLPEQALSRVRANQDVSILVDAYGERRFHGRITTVEPQIDPSSRTLRVQATLANPDGDLAAGMYANARIALPERVNVVTVPETAVSYSAYGNLVYVVAQAEKTVTVKQIYVKTGERTEGRVVVTEGLSAGDRVVTSGQIRLHNGATVDITPDDTVALVQDGASPPVR